MATKFRVYKQLLVNTPKIWVAKLDDDSSRTRIALYMGHERHAKAKRLLFNVLNKHIENWWN